MSANDGIAPALVAGFRETLLLAADGTARRLSPRAAAGAVADGIVPILCHAPQVAQRLGSGPFPAFDLLELFAFVRPARFCLPTPGGIADALELPRPRGLEAAARLLHGATAMLLAELAEADEREDAARLVRAMQDGGWRWAPHALAALGEDAAAPDVFRDGGYDVWRRLPEWSEHAPETAAGNLPVTSGEARARLARLVGPDAEDRPQQGDYASALTAAFSPREAEGQPNLVIAEAGTGVGKTLGYLAPASLWAEKNRGPVWISTYTRNLQRQIDTELDRLHPDAAVKARRVVVRKGRENYLCLLNMEEAAGRMGLRAGDATGLGLLARWAAHTRDGDMVGGDFPSWLAQLAGYRNTLALADRRGECVYSACAHYHKCFIERAVRRARRADIVIANHALVMTQAALGGLDDANVPTRLVFDEGHHVFDAADGAFSARLGGQEAADLRHWLLGAEEGRRSRARGLRRRIEDIAFADAEAGKLLESVTEAARALPGPGWLGRLAAGAPRGPAEAFLARVRQQVYARAGDSSATYDIETEVAPPVAELPVEAALLARALAGLDRPMRSLAARLEALLDEGAKEFDTAARNRIEAVGRGLRRRSEGALGAWRSMLSGIGEDTPPEFVDWLSVSRSGGRDVDVSMNRHWIDPTIPFARSVSAPAHGVVVTSATLRDSTGDGEADWRAAEARTGAMHLDRPPLRATAPSPFDYARRTRILAVTDLRRDDAAQIAGAYRALFLAAGGGAIGLFTAISRLRAVHERIAPALEAAGLDLLAQHVDNLDVASLIDIFRAEEDSCLLGTDAVRDGIDVPGRSLRLIVFDRIPWGRPTILHRARRGAFAPTAAGYDDMIARLRLKQAYGRLVRRADDLGVFVILARMPSRLAGAFPEGVAIERCGLAEAVRETGRFLGGS